MAARSTIDPDQFLDPIWRVSNLYHITDKNGARVPFKPNDAQLSFLKDLHQRNIILKARQLGFTTLSALIQLDACIFGRDVRAGIIAHRLDDAKVIFRDKVKYPYDNLDEGLRAEMPATQDSADTLTFANGSSIRVSTSMRSGTLQYLHISEYGKICAQYPDKAREIKTGALEAVSKSGFVTIESTAEGQEGDFFDKSQEARRMQTAGAELSPLDYRFHFFPWHQDPEYSLPGLGVITDEQHRYFEKLEAEEGIVLSRGQKLWYVTKEGALGGDMKREYPSTPDEAFEQALEGAFFTRELHLATKQRRIGSFSVDPAYQVHTAWDLGRNDLNTIWLFQTIGGFHRFVGYYENSGEHISHYVKWLRDWADENGVTFGSHYLPHDGKRESLWLENGTMGVMEKLRFFPTIVPRAASHQEIISACRAVFHLCQFDEQAAGDGLKRLRAFRKEWDDVRGVFKDRYLHDINSHGAMGFATFALSGHSGDDITVSGTRRRGYFDDEAEGCGSWMTA
ncbi:terminase [Stappia indica]|uniref:terminase n=1 Tax=Stappia indica TaxID=538381 RepID=UPI001CD5D150|nr:terminase [Stappia indica]MCA1298030.1 terminase [Stappia indica]